MSRSRKSESPRRRPGRLVRFAVVALIAALIPTVMAAGTGTASAAVSRPAAPAALKTVRFRVTNATAVLLRRDTYLDQRGKWREHPADTPSLTTDDYTLESVGGEAKGRVVYFIGSTDYNLFVEADNPLIGANTSTCEIRVGGTKVTNSPYECEKKIGGGNDTNADFVVQPKTATTRTINPDDGLFGPGLSQRDALDRFCTEPTTYATCTVPDKADVRDVRAVVGAERIVSQILVNCSTSSASKTLTTSYTVGETNTIGVTVEAQFKMSDIVTTKIATTYQHQWSHSVTNSETTGLNVAPGEYGYLSVAPWMQQVRANYTLKAGNQTLLVPDVTLLRPSENDPDHQDFAITHSFPLTDRDQVCSGHNGGNFLTPRPISPAPGRTAYTINLATENQRSIGVPHNSHSPSTFLELQAASSARSQQWVFYSVPGYPDYFQIRSSNTLSLCLDLDGINNRSVEQFNCKPADSTIISNQLWRLIYDPDTKAYRVIPMVNTDKSLAVYLTGHNPGDEIIGTTDAGVNESRWVFREVP